MEVWMQSFTILIANFGIIWWFRKESREDWKMMREEANAFTSAVRAEMKDFHERLLDIEKERK